jgi:hypothetical protein
MKYFFWAMLSNMILGGILAVLSFNSEFSFTILSTMVFYGLVLKGIFSLDKTETHFRTVMVLTAFILVGAIFEFIGAFISNDFINSIVAWFAMVTSVSAIFAEYNLIKGIQSYKPVLSQPKQADKLLLYWKMTMISVLVLIVTLIIAIIAFAVVIIMTYGLEQTQPVIDQYFVMEMMLEAARANGVLSVVLLVIGMSAMLVNITARILMIVSMYAVYKDHKQGLSEQILIPAVE